jgi:hypothetical protein
MKNERVSLFTWCLSLYEVAINLYELVLWLDDDSNEIQ